jgi:hypothetical protein
MAGLAGLADVGLVTYSELPNLVPDDRLLLEELERRGLRAVPLVWDDERINWADFTVCVIRETWDYHHRLGEFLEWVVRAGAATGLLNPPEAVRWNTHKGYLRELEARGVPIVPTVWVHRGTDDDLAEIMSQKGWERVVVKPAVSASSFETVLVEREELSKGQSHLKRLATLRDMMVQPFLPLVQTAGERSLMFVEGLFTHAVRRSAPFGAGVGELGEARLIDVSGAEIDLGKKVLEVAGVPYLYARVDIAPDEDGIMRLMELELVEPSLFLEYSADAVRLLADGIERAVARRREAYRP